MLLAKSLYDLYFNRYNREIVLLRNIQFLFRSIINYELQKLSYSFDRDLAKPTRLIFSLTDRCCLNCEMCECSQMRGKKEDELSTEKWKRIFLDIKEWLKDSFYLHLTGGEPLMRSDILALLYFASANKIKTLVNTNGYLIDKRLARGLADSGLNYLAVSLDGIQPETVDRIRGVSGAYERITTGLQYINAYKKKDMMLGISAVILDSNLDELGPLVRWAAEKKIDRVGFHALREKQSFEPHKPKGSAGAIPDLWVKDMDKLDRIIDELVLLKKQGFPIINSTKHLNTMKTYYRNPAYSREDFKCLVGTDIICVLTDGWVQLCRKMDDIGNLNQSSIREIWFSQKAKERRREIKNCKQQCLNKTLYSKSFKENAELLYFLLKKKKFELLQ